MKEEFVHERKCKCHHLPKEGKFTIGNTYKCTSCIDGTGAIDENGESVFGMKLSFCGILLSAANDKKMNPQEHRLLLRIFLCL